MVGENKNKKPDVLGATAANDVKAAKPVFHGGPGPGRPEKRIVRGFHVRLCQQMKKKRFRAQDLAKHCGVSVHTVRHWMYANREPSLYCAVQLAALFEISNDELLTGRKPIEELANHLLKAGGDLSQMRQRLNDFLARLNGGL